MSITTYKVGSSQMIEWTWYRPSFRTYLILLFTLCLDALVIFVGAKLIAAGQYSSLVILILFPFLALVMTYFQIAIFINKTSIEIQEKTLRVFAGPLPFYSAREYLRADIKNVVAEERSGRKAGTFNVKLVLSDGKKKIILSLPSADEARIVERELQTALKA